MMNIKSITSQNVKGKKVLLRAPFDVPLNGRKIADPTRIEKSLPTIEYLLQNNAAIVIISKLGRPGGKKVSSLSLSPVAKFLSKKVSAKVSFIKEAIGPIADKAKKEIRPGEIIVLENLRFYHGEEENDPKFAKELSKEMDLFVFEDFPNAKNNHAGVTGVAKILPTFAGINFKEEIERLSEVVDSPQKPLVSIVGGAKISTKIDVLLNLIEKTDILILGGGMANTFLAAEGYDVGKSFFEEEFLDEAEEISRKAYDEMVELLLPDDVVVSKKVGSNRTTVKPIENIAKGDIIVDIGPKSISKFAQPINFAGTIFWNGPLGIAEYKSSSKGTESIAKIVSESKATSIVAGGDTIASLSKVNLKFDHISTGGGSALEFIAGNKPPILKYLVQ